MFMTAVSLVVNRDAIPACVSLEFAVAIAFGNLTNLYGLQTHFHNG